MPSGYAARARLAPALLLFAPAFALLVTLGFSPAILGTMSVGVVAAVAAIGAGHVADRGRALQHELFAQWGGSPTSARLRQIHTADPELTRQRRETVENATGKPLPSAAIERSDRAAVEDAFGRAIDQVRAGLREHESNRILADTSAEYGFRRNCLAVRWRGLAVALVRVRLCCTPVCEPRRLASDAASP